MEFSYPSTGKHAL